MHITAALDMWSTSVWYSALRRRVSWNWLWCVVQTRATAASVCANWVEHLQHLTEKVDIPTHLSLQDHWERWHSEHCCSGSHVHYLYPQSRLPLSLLHSTTKNVLRKRKTPQKSTEVLLWTWKISPLSECMYRLLMCVLVPACMCAGSVDSKSAKENIKIYGAKSDHLSTPESYKRTHACTHKRGCLRPGEAKWGG